MDQKQLIVPKEREPMIGEAIAQVCKSDCGDLMMQYPELGKHTAALMNNAMSGRIDGTREALESFPREVQPLLIQVLETTQRNLISVLLALKR